LTKFVVIIFDKIMLLETFMKVLKLKVLFF